MARVLRLFLVGFAALIGAIAGLIIGRDEHLAERRSKVAEFPMPYHIPKYQGGVSLRFAMVHDVIHERFPRHGEAYYQERNRRVLEAIEKTKGRRDDASFALLDDLGAGLDRLHRDDEAVRVLRDKLQQQQERGLRGRALYTTYANLGTFLIHGNIPKARSGDAGAKDRLREGLDFIHKAIKVNPQAHFGREVWQAVTVQYMLEAIDRPAILLDYDLTGNRLDQTVDLSQADSLLHPEMYTMFRNDREILEYVGDKVEDGKWLKATQLRENNIARVGAGEGWNKALVTDVREPVPFDEPTLGIIGMWRLGGGANPHFARTLGEIMLQVGQRHIAWCAYERAVRLADRFWPDPDIQRRFIEQCRRRQAAIESSLSADEVTQLRPRFEAELAHGERYQHAYQGYEAEHIRAGGSIDDPHFYDDFDAQNDPIASPPGQVEKYVVKLGPSPYDYINGPAILLGAGLAAFATACLMRLMDLRRAWPQ